MASEYETALFHPEAYLIAELETLDEIPENGVEYVGEKGFVVDYEPVSDLLEPEESILESVREEKPYVFAYLEGDVKQLIDDRYGDIDAVTRSRMGENLVERDDSWKSASLEGTKIVVSEDPKRTWRSYRREVSEPVKMDLGLPRNQIGFKAD